MEFLTPQIISSIWGRGIMKRINRVCPSHASVTKNLKLNSIVFLVRQHLLFLCFFMILAFVPLSMAHANDFGAWTDSASNPLFVGGANSGVDRAYYPSIIKVGSIYHIWYGDGIYTRHATSALPDFSDVIFPAPAVTGLSTGAYHPRVLYSASGWTIGVTFYSDPFLIYSTTGANWNLSPRVARSLDGDAWNDIGECTGVSSYIGIPNTSIYNLDVLYEGGTTWKAYADNGLGHIEYYESNDGLTWTVKAHNILSSLQAWETSFTSPHVIKSGSQYIMYYGSGLVNNQGIGVAFSSDGQNFTKSNSNPIFSTSGAPDWRKDRTYTPYVTPNGTSWIMYYTGRSSSSGVYSIGYALPTSLPPAGSVTINSGAASTNSTTVTLTLPCSDSTGCSQMCISNTSTCSSWESYSSPKSWTLPLGDGTKMVYAWFRNGIGNENTSPYSDSIILDTSVPTPGGNDVTINLPNGGSMTFTIVDSACYTTLTEISNPTHNPPPNFNFIRYGYFDISTNCNYTGPVTVVYPYDESEISGQEQNLKLFHWKNNGWEDSTVSVDTVNNTITGQVDTLSPFGIGYYYSGGGGGGGYSTGANENMIAMIAIFAISAGLFILRRNRWIKV
jgi:hypothetical protein